MCMETHLSVLCFLYTTYLHSVVGVSVESFILHAKCQLNQRYQLLLIQDSPFLQLTSSRHQAHQPAAHQHHSEYLSCSAYFPVASTPPT